MADGRWLKRHRIGGLFVQMISTDFTSKTNRQTDKQTNKQPQTSARRNAHRGMPPCALAPYRAKLNNKMRSADAFFENNHTVPGDLE